MRVLGVRLKEKEADSPPPMAKIPAGVSVRIQWR